MDSGALPTVDRWFGTPLLSQQVQTFLQARIELQHARDSEQEGPVERHAGLVAIGLVCGQKLAILKVVEDRMAVIQLTLRQGAGVEHG